MTGGDPCGDLWFEVVWEYSLYILSSPAYGGLNPIVPLPAMGGTIRGTLHKS